MTVWECGAVWVCGVWVCGAVWVCGSVDCLGERYKSTLWVSGTNPSTMACGNEPRLTKSESQHRLRERARSLGRIG